MDINTLSQRARKLLDREVSPEIAYWAGWLAGFNRMDRRTGHERFFRSEDIIDAWSDGYTEGVVMRLQVIKERRS